MQLRFVLVIIFVLAAGSGALSDTVSGLGGSGNSEFAFYFGVTGYGNNGRFGEPVAVALDKRTGLIYVADSQKGTVDAFSLQGTPKFQYGRDQGLKSPSGLAVGRLGDLYVSENEGGPVKAINPTGSLSVLALPRDKDQDVPKPGRMSIDRDGNIYVVDETNNQLCFFDKTGKFRFKIGQTGDREGQFKMLRDVGVDGQGRIYALDSLGVPLQVFDRSGKYIYRFGVRGEGDGQLSFPTAVFVDRYDQIWVVDRSQHSLKVFDRSGALLRTFGSYGLSEGTLFHPVSAAIDDIGRVYVVEVGARRLQVFSTGRRLEPFRPLGL